MDKLISPRKPKKFSENVDSKQWNKIRNNENEYPSLNIVKRAILEEEKSVAENFSDLESALRKRKDRGNSQLEFDLEWFLTWRIKLVAYRTCLWCDGVEIGELKPTKDFEFFLSAEIWLGPESNVNKEYKCKMVGTISVNKKFNKLKGYNLEIDYKGDKIFVLK